MTIVQIEWLDSFRTHGWLDAEDATSRKEMDCYTIAYLVSENDKSITVATSHDGNDDPKFLDPLTIPRVAIVGYWEIELE